MPKFISKISAFLLFTVFFYSLILFFWGSYMPSQLRPNLVYLLAGAGHSFSRLKEVKTVSDLDVLFLGSSHAYRGFDTRIFQKYGFKTFNLGSTSQTPLQTLMLLKRYLDQLNPRLVVFEVYPIIFSLDGVESALDIIPNDQNDVYSLKMALAINHVKVYNTLLYATIQDFLELNRALEEPLKRGSDLYVSGGFVEREMAHYRATVLPKAATEVKETQRHSFEAIVHMLDARQIPLILVYAPIPASNYKRYSDNKAFDTIMKNYSTYYNFNQILHLDDSLHFYDSDHLNQFGVEIFNGKLAEIIWDKLK